MRPNSQNNLSKKNPKFEFPGTPSALPMNVTVQMTTKKEEGGRRGSGEEDNQKRSSMRERMSGHFSPGLFFLGEGLTGYAL